MFATIKWIFLGVVCGIFPSMIPWVAIYFVLTCLGEITKSLQVK